MYKELTGIKTQPPLRDPKGTFFQYGYFQFGALSFSTPGWGLDADTEAGNERGASTQAAGPARAARGAGAARGMSTPGASKSDGMDQKFISYLDKDNAKGFVDWQTFNHPDLGELEIGGFSPYEIVNPPASKIAELGEAHGKFAVWASGLYANVKIASTEVVDHGGGLFRIKAEIENIGFLPTSLSHGVASRSVSPTMVQLGVIPESIISGNSKTNFFQALDGSGKRVKYEWLVKGKSGDKIELKVVAQKAGTDRVNITLK